MTPLLLKEFENIKFSLDTIADAYNIDAENSPQYADAVTGIDKLCKVLMQQDFQKENHNGHT